MLKCPKKYFSLKHFLVDVVLGRDQYLNSYTQIDMPKVNDKRCKEREVRYTKERHIKLDPESGGFELTALLSMLLGILAVWKDWKYAAWGALLLGVINVRNREARHEVKQIFSQILVAGAALYVLYMRDPTPLVVEDA